MAEIVCTAADFADFFKGLPFNIGSYYNNSFPYNCLYYQRDTADNVPVYSADCWNMIKAAIWNDLALPTPIGSYSYHPGKYGLQDLNGYQLINSCSDVSSDFIAPHAGEFLVTASYDHAGIYVGGVTDGTHYWNVVECTPIWANGIQFTWVDVDGTRRQYKGGPASVYWAKHGKLPWVDYTENPPTPDPDPDPDPPQPYVPNPEMPSRNISVYVVDKDIKRINIIRDNAPTEDEKTFNVGENITSVLIDFEDDNE